MTTPRPKRDIDVLEKEVKILRTKLLQHHTTSDITQWGELCVLCEEIDKESSD